MKQVIYYGAEKPAKFIGEHQCNLGNFAFRNPGWHSYLKNDRKAIRAIEALTKKGYLEHSVDTMQFKWK